jgi:hypothetical protein
VTVAPPAKPGEPLIISEGKEAVLVDHLKAEGPTVVLFYQPANADEAELLTEVRKRIDADSRVALRLVKVAALDAPIARQYELEATPALFIYDRNKNLLGKAKTIGEAGPIVARALRTARIKWVDETDPTAPDVFKMFGGGRQPVPEIMKTMSLNPEMMETFAVLSRRFHFSDGFLPRRTKEMIASYVSALNKCKY